MICWIEHSQRNGPSQTTQRLQLQRPNARLYTPAALSCNPKNSDDESYEAKVSLLKIETWKGRSEARRKVCVYMADLCFGEA